MMPMEAGQDPVKKALNNLIKAMYGKMDYSVGEEEMGEGEIADAMDPESEEMGYDPISEGDAEPQASLDEEGEDEGIGDEIKDFFKGPKISKKPAKEVTMISMSAKPKKKTRGKNYRKKDL